MPDGSRQIMNEEQYSVIASRRLTTGDWLWQTPGLATAAQAFLLASALDFDAPRPLALVLCLFSLAVGVASLHLFLKNRYGERLDARFLRDFEIAHQDEGYVVLHGNEVRHPDVKERWWHRISAGDTWTVVLAGFCALAFFAMLWTQLQGAEISIACDSVVAPQTS